MSEPFLGQLMLVGFNFAPRGWALCNGQLLSISQNTALFSLLGTTYGGDGVQTFGLPNLRGRVPLHYGQAPSGVNYSQGQVGGEENVTLTQQQMPQHSHQVLATSDDATKKNPVGSLPAASGGSVYAETPNGVMLPAMIGVSGSSQPHDNMQPLSLIHI